MRRTPNEETLLMTADDVATALRLSLRQVWRLRSAGKLPPPVRIGRMVRWGRQDIERWLDDLKGGKNAA